MVKRKRKARSFAPSEGKKTSNVVLARTDSVISISSKRSIEDGARESEIDDSRTRLETRDQDQDSVISTEGSDPNFRS